MTRIPANFPSPAEDYLKTDWTDRNVIGMKAATSMMRADGDSMRETGILDGDLVEDAHAAKRVSGSAVVRVVKGE